MSHAAPTVCMNVPISDMTSASSRLRKSGVRNGRHGLPAPTALRWSASLVLSDARVTRFPFHGRGCPRIDLSRSAARA